MIFIKQTGGNKHCPALLVEVEQYHPTMLRMPCQPFKQKVNLWYVLGYVLYKELMLDRNLFLFSQRNREHTQPAT